MTERLPSNMLSQRCRRTSSLMEIPLFISVLVLFFLIGERHAINSLSTVSKSPRVVLSVCQNKYCCQKFGLRHANLVQTLERLLPTSASDIAIEATGCQSKCDFGPNVACGDKMYNSVGDAQAAAAVLEMAVDGLTIPSSLLAASTVMEKAQLVDSLEKKEQFLNSVVKVLEKDPDTSESNAIAHAHVLRAIIRLDLGRPKDAVQDAQQATKICPSHPTAWRTLADAQEASGNIVGAMTSLTNFAAVKPQFSTKVNKEKARLLTKV